MENHKDLRIAKENSMTREQLLAKELWEASNRPKLDFDEMKFKIQNDKEYHFRFVPDGNADNSLFFQNYKMYKLSDTIYVNYPSGYNQVQELLNALWATGDSSAKALYSSYKGKETHNTAVVLCDSSGKPLENKSKIFTITSKNLWNEIMEHYFESDFMDNPTTLFTVKRTGQKLETKYTLTRSTVKKIDFETIEKVNLSLPLAFKKSDTKALPILRKLNSQFNLGLKFGIPKTESSKDDAITITDDDEFEKALLKEIEDL